jgi:hypothetical protein
MPAEYVLATPAGELPAIIGENKPSAISFFRRPPSLWPAPNFFRAGFSMPLAARLWRGRTARRRGPSFRANKTASRRIRRRACCAKHNSGRALRQFL